MKKCADYIAKGKEVLDNPGMSDRELGERLGSQIYMSQLISRAKRGYMLDSMALDLGRLLAKHKAIEHPGEVLMVARAERERDIAVRATMLDYVGKILAAVPSKAASVIATLAVALSASFLPARDAHAVGGAGGFRP